MHVNWLAVQRIQDEHEMAKHIVNREDRVKHIAVALFALTLVSCGGGGGSSDYWFGQIATNSAILQTCDPQFSTEAACKAAEATCRAAYKFPPVPSNARYECVHHTSN